MTHEVSSTLVESDPCMWGNATLVMLVSRICITVMSITEMVMDHFRVEDSVEDGCAGSGKSGVGQGRGAAPPSPTSTNGAQ